MKEKLIQLGFTDKEALAYETLLNMGPLAASTLARLTGVKRTSVYDVMSGLLERNLVMSFKQGLYTFYVVDDVNKLYLHEREKADLAKTLVEDVRKGRNKLSGSQVYYYKGLAGYREMYEDILKHQPKQVRVWMNLDFFLKGIDPKREEHWTKERVKKNIFAHLLVQKTPTTAQLKKEDSNNHRETRFLPENCIFKSTCILYEGTVNLLESSQGFIGLRIQNPEFYQMFETLFDWSWEAAKQ